MDDVAFYDSQVQYQKRVGEIERERLRLEREMFSMMRSDKKLQSLKAAKLKSYWQQVCDREKKARERNEQLLKDFEVMEIELSALQTQTNKLRRMKAEYDEKVKQMYPKWRQEVEISRAKKQLRERGIRTSPRRESEEPEPHPSYSRTEPHHSFSHPEMTSPSRSHEKSFSPRKEDPGNMRRPKHAADSFVSNMDKSELSNTSKASTKKGMVSSHQPVSTSTPISVKSQSQLASEASMQPPPESFADATPQKVVYVNTTSPIKSSTSGGRNVIHTIPTAQSLQEEPSEISELSTFSEPDRQNEKVASVPATGLTGPIVIKPWASANVGGGNPSQNDGQRILSPAHSSHSHQELSGKQGSRNKGKLNSISSGSPTRSDGRFSPTDQPNARSPMSTLSSHGGHTKSPEHKVEKSASISSFGSDEMSPRAGAPLTANATYQALLKQHSGNRPALIDIPNVDEESDEDDLENLLSPHGLPVNDRNQGHQEDGNGNDSERDDSFSDGPESPVYIPTAMSTGSSIQARGPSNVAQSKAPKVPWDTDTDDDSFEDTSFLATGGSSLRHSEKKPQPLDPQDDFDFYD